MVEREREKREREREKRERERKEREREREEREREREREEGDVLVITFLLRSRQVKTFRSLFSPPRVRWMPRGKCKSAISLSLSLSLQCIRTLDFMP